MIRSRIYGRVQKHWKSIYSRKQLNITGIMKHKSLTWTAKRNWEDKHKKENKYGGIESPMTKLTVKIVDYLFPEDMAEDNYARDGSWRSKIEGRFYYKSWETEEKDAEDRREREYERLLALSPRSIINNIHAELANPHPKAEILYVLFRSFNAEKIREMEREDILAAFNLIQIYNPKEEVMEVEREQEREGDEYYNGEDYYHHPGRRQISHKHKDIVSKRSEKRDVYLLTLGRTVFNDLKKGILKPLLKDRVETKFRANDILDDYILLAQNLETKILYELSQDPEYLSLSDCVLAMAAFHSAGEGSHTLCEKLGRRILGGNGALTSLAINLFLNSFPHQLWLQIPTLRDTPYKHFYTQIEESIKSQIPQLDNQLFLSLFQGFCRYGEMSMEFMNAYFMSFVYRLEGHNSLEPFNILQFLEILLLYKRTNYEKYLNIDITNLCKCVYGMYLNEHINDLQFFDIVGFAWVLYGFEYIHTPHVVTLFEAALLPHFHTYIQFDDQDIAHFKRSAFQAVHDANSNTKVDKFMDDMVNYVNVLGLAFDQLSLTIMQNVANIQNRIQNKKSRLNYEKYKI